MDTQTAPPPRPLCKVGLKGDIIMDLHSNTEGELKKQDPKPMGGMSGRQHARDALKASIIRLERQLAALRTLERAINWKLLNDEQEENLWTYFVRAR